VIKRDFYLSAYVPKQIMHIEAFLDFILNSKCTKCVYEIMLIYMFKLLKVLANDIVKLLLMYAK